MAFASWILLLAMVLIICVLKTLCQQRYIISLNSNNETDILSCWTGEFQIPCQNLESILEKGKKLLSNKTEVSSGKKTSNANSRDGVECSTWMHYSNKTDQCVCGVSHHGMVKCNATLNETYILDCHRMTYDEENKQVVAGLSFYGCLDQAQLNDVYHPVPANRSQINNVMCGDQFNRDGRLCGACMDGYSPLVYSYQLYCKKCSDVESKYNWAKFIIMAFVPLTAFYICVVLFRFNVNSPQLQGYLLFTQFITCSANTRIIMSAVRYGSIVAYPVKILSIIYGVWNLDFFRTLYPDICLDIVQW